MPGIYRHIPRGICHGIYLGGHTTPTACLTVKHAAKLYSKLPSWPLVGTPACAPGGLELLVKVEIRIYRVELVLS